jgi:hypothetical protein
LSNDFYLNCCNALYNLLMIERTDRSGGQACHLGLRAFFDALRLFIFRGAAASGNVPRVTATASAGAAGPATAGAAGSATAGATGSATAGATGPRTAGTWRTPRLAFLRGSVAMDVSDSLELRWTLCIMIESERLRRNAAGGSGGSGGGVRGDFAMC